MHGNMIPWLILLLICETFVQTTANYNSCSPSVGGETYTGNINITASGKPCVSWSTYTACVPDLPDQNTTVPIKSCRNPSGRDICHREKLWCYTDNGGSWEFCDIPICGKENNLCSTALGMGNGRVTNSQITGYPNSSSNPSLARINSANSAYWDPQSTANPYIHIDFFATKRVTKIFIQGGTQNSYTTAFKVGYTINGLTWQLYSDSDDDSNPTEFSGNHGTDINPVYFSKPFLATEIALFPTSVNWGSGGMRLEFYGCSAITNQTNSTDIKASVIQVDTEWGYGNSPYIVSQMLTISPGATLAIDAGVEVVFVGRSAGLLVNGCLQIKGSDSVKVRFVSDNPMSLVWNSDETGSSPFWQGIVINDKLSSCQPILENAIIVGGRLAIAVPVFTVFNIEVRNSRVGIEIISLELLFQNWTFDTCTLRGNQVGMRLNNSGSVLSSSFIGNQIAIQLTSNQFSVPTSIQIADSVFASNNQGITTDINTWGGERINLTLLVEGCSFNQHANYGIRLDYASYYDPQMITALIQDCNLNASGIYLNSGKNSIDIDNSTFTNSPQNSLSIGGWCKTVTLTNSTFINSTHNAFDVVPSYLETIQLYGNRFYRNSESYCINIDFRWMPNGQIPRSDTNIIGNWFINNSVSTAAININDISKRNYVITKNIFNNPHSKYELYVTSSYQFNNVISASGNWWGRSDKDWVQARIYDFFIDPSKAVVEVSSVYKDSDLTVLIDSPSWRWSEWKMVNNSIGGRLVENVTIGSRLFTVYGSINIPKFLRLEIHNAELRFLGRSVIIVDGELLFDGIDITATGNIDLFLIRLNNSSRTTFSNSKLTLPRDNVLYMVDSSLDITNCIIVSSKFVYATSESSSISVMDSSITSTNVFEIVTGTDPMILTLTNTSISSTNDYATVISGPGALFISMERCSVLSVNNHETIRIDTTGNITFDVSYSNIQHQLYFSKEHDRSEAVVFMQTSEFIFFEMRGSSVISQIAYSVTIDNYNGSRKAKGGYANFTDNSFQNGIYISSVTVNVLATNNKFWCTTYDCLYISSATFPDSLNCHILRNNTFQGLSRCVHREIGEYYDTPSCVHIGQNTFSGCSNYLHFASSLIDIQITRNVFQNASGNGVALLLQLDNPRSWNPGKGNDAIQITDNIFEDTNGVSVVSLVCDPAYIASVEIRGNTFLGNRVQGVVNSSCAGLYLIKNRFENPLSSYDFSTTTSFKNGLMIHIMENFWNSSTYTDVLKRIYDHQDDSTVAVTEAIPWYIDSNLRTLIPDRTSFIRGDGYEIGGTMTEDVVLVNRGQPYTVVEDILVPFGIKLAIEAGVQLDFEDSGVTVKGMLDAQGSEQEWISLNPARNVQFWKGLVFQQPYDEQVMKNKQGWWEFQYQSKWFVVQYYPGFDNIRGTADVICRQAGYAGTASFGAFDCSSSSTSCSSIVNKGLIRCSGSEMSVTECEINFDFHSVSTFMNLSCTSSQSRIYTRIRGTLGRNYISFRPSSNQIQFGSLLISSSTLDDEANQFVMASPCLDPSTTMECFSIMSLQKPGWYIRHFGNDLLLESQTNPQNPSSFSKDASFFVRTSPFNGGFKAMESINLPGFFIYMNGSSSLLVLVNLTQELPTSYKNASFTFIEYLSLQSQSVQNVSSNPRPNTSDKRSKLSYVSISRASNGILVRGRFPSIDHIKMERIINTGINYTGFATGNISISNCNISDVGGIGVHLATSKDSYLSNIVISDCHIERCQQQGINQQGYGNLTVRNSALWNNSVSKDLVFVGGNTDTFQFSNNIIQYNMFQQNIMRVLAAQNHVELSYNSFTDNFFTGSTPSQFATLSIDFSYDTVIANNQFNNPNVTYEVQMLTSRNDSRDKLDLSMNFWNRRNYSAILSRINCFDNNIGLMPANIWPAILDLGTGALLFSSNNSSYFFENGLGGDVHSLLIIPRANTPYLVQRNIFIRRYATLVIDQNVTLIFPAKFGIVGRGNLAIRGTATSPVRLISAETYSNRTNNPIITIVQQISSNFSYSVYIDNVIVTRKQISLISPSIEIHNTEITIGYEYGYNTDNALQIQGGNVTVSNCTFSTSYYAVNMNRHTWFSGIPSSVTITGCSFYNNHFGIYSSFNYDAMTILNSTFVQTEWLAIFVGLNSYYLAENLMNATFSIRSSTFVNNTQSVFIDARDYNVSIELSDSVFSDSITRSNQLSFSGYGMAGNSAKSILIRNNKFLSLPFPALSINKDYIWSVVTKMFVSVDGNTFANISNVAMSFTNLFSANFSVTLNEFISNNAVSGPSAIEAYFDQIRRFDQIYPGGDIRFTSNNFTKNTGSYVIKVAALTRSNIVAERLLPSFKISANIFSDNAPTDSVIYSDFSIVKVNNNIFQSTQSLFYMRVNSTNGTFEDCTNNWWGTNVEADILQRIYDGRRDPLVGQVTYKTYLNSSQIKCDGVSQCSGHGVCIFPDTCKCSAGWIGVDCSVISCKDMFDCFGQGTCVGPNQCPCFSGLSGSTCSKASCIAQNGCSNHGICASPNVCQCFLQYSGPNCTECSVTAGGPSCQLYPNCNHGQCDPNSDFTCQSPEAEACLVNGGACENFHGGYVCICPPNKVGYNCELDKPSVSPMFDRLSKSFGPASGGGNLILYGVNVYAFPPLIVYFTPVNPHLTTLYSAVNRTSRNSANELIISPPGVPYVSYLKSDFNISVEYTGPINITTPLAYSYIANPEIYDIQPREVSPVGGIRLTVSGDRFDGISKAIMVVTLITTGVVNNTNGRNIYQQVCSIETAQVMICILPLFHFDRPQNVRKRRQGDSNPQQILGRSETINPFNQLQLTWGHTERRRRTSVSDLSTDNYNYQMYLGFYLDGYQHYGNISSSLPDVKIKLLTRRPTFDDVSGGLLKYDPSQREDLKIKGSGMNVGCSKEDYHVKLGSGKCEVDNLLENSLGCLPPIYVPTMETLTSEKCQKWADSLALMVQFGAYEDPSTTYFIACVMYSVNTNNIPLIVGLVVGLGGPVLFIAMALIVVYSRRCRTRKLTPGEIEDEYQRTLNGEHETNIDDDGEYLPDGTGDRIHAVSHANDSTGITFVNRDSTGNVLYSRSFTNEMSTIIDNNSDNGGYPITGDVDSDPVGTDESSEKTSNQNLGPNYYLNDEQGDDEPGSHSTIGHVQKTPTELATTGSQNPTPNVIPPPDYYLNQDQEEPSDDAPFGDYLMTNSASGGVPDNFTTGSQTTMFPRPLEIKSEEGACLRDPQVKKQPLTATYSVTDA